MLLVSRCSQVATIADHRIKFEEGEAICTEYSHKYTVEEFAAMAATAGLELHKEWTDRHRLFAVLHFAVVGDAIVSGIDHYMLCRDSPNLTFVGRVKVRWYSQLAESVYDQSGRRSFKAAA